MHKLTHVRIAQFIVNSISNRFQKPKLVSNSVEGAVGEGKKLWQNESSITEVNWFQSKNNWFQVTNLRRSKMQHVFDFSTIAAGSQVGIMVSPIPDAGRGLFTYRDVREGRTIGEYFGTDVIRDHDYGDLNDIIASYSMGNHDSSHIYCAFSIGTRTMLCMMGYINDPLDDLMCNVRPVRNGHRCRIVATRDIVAGEEFLMAYGDISWMRDIWPSGIIERAWQNYGTRRTNAACFRFFHNCGRISGRDPVVINTGCWSRIIYL